MKKSISKSLFVFTLFLCLGFHAKSQQRFLQWAVSTSSTSNSAASGKKVLTDSQGSIYVFSSVWNDVDFDPSNSIFMLSSGSNIKGKNTMAKFDSYGSFKWAIILPESTSDFCVSPNGDLVFTGTFSDTVDFDPGSNVHIRVTKGFRDVFILTLDNQGRFKTVRTFGGIKNDMGFKICNDDTGNLFVFGSFTDSLILDSSQSKLKVFYPNTSGYFILSMSQTGQFNWVKKLNSISHQMLLNDLHFSQNQRIHLLGKSNGDFEYWSSDTNRVFFNCGNSPFVLSLSLQGEYLTAAVFDNRFNPLGRDRYVHNSLSSDSEGGIVTTGIFEGTQDFDPDTGVFNLASKGNRDIFILKLDSNSKLKWAHAIGGSNRNYGYSVVVDKKDDIYVTGQFSTWNGLKVDFNPGPGKALLSTVDTPNVFVLKLSPSGQYKSVWQLGDSTYKSVGRSIHLDKNENILITGQYERSGDFDPGFQSTVLSSIGLDDMFIAKYSKASTSSINETFVEHTSIYPNPISSNQDLIINTENTSPTTIKLYDLHGRILNVRNDLTGPEIRLGLDQGPGVYLLKVEQEGQVQTFKIVKR